MGQHVQQPKASEGSSTMLGPAVYRNFVKLFVPQQLAYACGEPSSVFSSA